MYCSDGVSQDVGHLGATSSLLDYLDATDDQQTLRRILGPTDTSFTETLQHGDPPENRVLSALNHLPVFIAAMSDEAGQLPSSVVLMPLAREMAKRLLPISQNIANKKDVARMAERIGFSTRPCSKLDRHATPEDLMAECTGSALRWETVGIVLSVAALLLLSSPQNVTETYRTQTCVQGRSALVHETIIASELCFSICGQYTEHKYLTVWHTYQSLLALRAFHGDSEGQVWRRLSNLSGKVIGHGLHQALRDKIVRTEFLDLFHARLYAMAYDLDKSISASLGLPPSLRTESSTITTLCTLHHDASLWTLEPLLPSEYSASEKPETLSLQWIRARLLVASVRDEILTTSSAAVPRNVESKLRYIKDSLESSWNNMPPELRVSDDHWNPARTIEYNCLLQINHLEHLYNSFLASQVQFRLQPGQPSRLVCVAQDLLFNTLNLGLQRSRLRSVKCNIPFFVMYFGIPAALTLASNLSTFDTTEADWPQIIQQLFAFVRCAEWSSDPDIPASRSQVQSLEVVRHAICAATGDESDRRTPLYTNDSGSS